MKVFQYEDKENKDKAWAVDAISVLQTMQDLEEFNGLTEERIVGNWYVLKGQMKDIILSELPKVEEKDTKPSN